MCEPSLRDIPVQYRRWTLADYKPSLREEIRAFLALDAWSLYLHGDIGARKSSIAAAIVRYIRGRSAWGSRDEAYGEWVAPERLRAAMLDFEDGKYVIEHWRQARLLVFDDLGALRSTPHAQETQMQLIATRYDASRPTIVTSNLTLADLAVQVDGRVASRLQEGVILDLGNKDWRKEKPQAAATTGKDKT